MKRISRVLATMVVAFVLGSVQAQTVSPVDFMRLNPYQINANPAADLPYESVMSILLGNTGLDVQTSTLRYDNLFEFDAYGCPTMVNLRQFANSLEKDNYLGLNTNIDFFTLYRRLNKGMLTLDYGVKLQSDAKFSDGLFKLLGYGNSAFVGEDNPASLDLDVNALAYQEVALGYQINVNDNLSLGGRAKMLFGLANVTTDACKAQLFTDPDTYALRLKENVALKAGLPDVICVKDGKLMGNGRFSVKDLFCNPGFGIDLGAEYRFNDQFSMVAAVNDLGFIHWGLNNIGLKSQVDSVGQFYDNGDFLFNGLSVEQLELITADASYSGLFLDSLKQYFHLEFAPMEAYNTMLNTNVLLRGNYDLDSHNRFSAQVQGRFLGSGFRPAMTLAYNGSFYEKLDVCVTYTMMPHSYDNIGLGISGRLFRTCNIFLASNNVIGFFKPLNSSAMNVQLGLVFVLRPEFKNTEYE